MVSERVFRACFVVLFLGTFLISGYFRRRARQTGEALSRSSEGSGRLVARLIGAALLYLPMMAYAVNPGWMEWSAIALPNWVRWLGVGVGLGALPLLYWVMTSIGKNVSETVLTKPSHELVSHGPYRWVRHPLYAVAALALVSLSVIAANGFMLTQMFGAPRADRGDS